MSLCFSKVTLTSASNTSFLLVSGIPKDRTYLQNWTAFRKFVNDNKLSPVSVRVETFLYGDGEPEDATPEEVAYLYSRIHMRPDFIEKRTRKYGENKFIITEKETKHG